MNITHMLVLITAVWAIENALLAGFYLAWRRFPLRPDGEPVERKPFSRSKRNKHKPFSISEEEQYLREIEERK